MFIYSVSFVRECMFLRSDKQSSVRFVDVRRITTRADEFINSPGCNSSYIGKRTELCLSEHAQDHALRDKESAIYKHLRDCDNIKHTFYCNEQRISHPNRA